MRNVLMFIPKRNRFTKLKRYNHERLGIILLSLIRNLRWKQYKKNFTVAPLRELQLLFPTAAQPDQRFLPRPGPHHPQNLKISAFL